MRRTFLGETLVLLAAVGLTSQCALPPQAEAVNQGAIALTAGRVDEALRHYDRAIAIDPTFAVAHCARGQALLRKPAPAEAAKAFRECVRLNPRHLDGLASLAAALVISCDFHGAQEALDELDRAKSQDARILENAEWVRVRLRKAALLGGRCLPAVDLEN